MKSVPIHVLKRHLAALIDEAEGGERIVVTRHKRAVATLAPPPSEGVRVGRRVGRGSLRPLAEVVDCAPIAATLADDRGVDR